MSNSTGLHPKIYLLLKVLLSGCIYFVLARLSLFLQFQSTHATPVWPSSGFALAIMLLWGYRMAPGILLGAFAANLMIFRDTSTVTLSTSILASLVIGIGNVSESLLGTYLIKKVFPEFNVNTFFEKVSDVFKFVLISIIICLVSSTIGSTTVHFTGLVISEQFLLVLITWWLGDFAGILLITSLIIIWIKSFRVTPPILYTGWQRKAEIVALYLAVILSSGIIFDEWIAALNIFKWAYMITPLIVWAAIRFNQREFITAVGIHSVIAVWGTINHHGPFGSLDLNDALIALQSFISILVITKLVLNASVLAQRNTEKILRDAGSVLEYHVRKRTAELEERNRFVETITLDLEKKNEDLVRMNEELSSFAFIASHDLQEPLRKIQIFSKRISETEKQSLSDVAKDYLHRMNKSANRMQLLIENLLTYSRAKSAERKFEKTPIQDVMVEVKEDLKEELAAHHAIIEAEDLCSVNINAIQFRQLLHNLISNSIKFSNPDVHLRIKITSKVALGKDLDHPKLDPKKEYCHIMISDNGIGFEPQFNEQIFGLFQRLHGKDEYPGTGIGLSICKKIVENHNGFITAFGEKGTGATFNLYVPTEEEPKIEEIIPIV